MRSGILCSLVGRCGQRKTVVRILEDRAAICAQAAHGLGVAVTAGLHWLPITNFANACGRAHEEGADHGFADVRIGAHYHQGLARGSLGLRLARMACSDVLRQTGDFCAGIEGVQHDAQAGGSRGHGWWAHGANFKAGGLRLLGEVEVDLRAVGCELDISGYRPGR